MNQPARTPYDPTRPDRQWIDTRGYLCVGYGPTAKRYHRVLYERHFGPIPPGHHVHHKDGDKRNNDLSNLELLTAADHLRRHNLDRIDTIRERARQQARHQPRDDRGRWLPQADPTRAGAIPRV